MAVGMCIVPAKIHSNFRWTDVFEISVVECGTAKHSKWVGFDTADSTKW